MTGRDVIDFLLAHKSDTFLENWDEKTLEHFVSQHLMSGEASIATEGDEIKCVLLFFRDIPTKTLIVETLCGEGKFALLALQSYCIKRDIPWDGSWMIAGKRHNRKIVMYKLNEKFYRRFKNHELREKPIASTCS